MNNGISRRSLILGTGALLLTGCEVPRGAPSRREVLSDAESPDADFVVELVTRERLPLYAKWGHYTPYRNTGWPAAGGNPMDQRLATGDTLELTIWDAEESSLLKEEGARASMVRNVTVSGSGHVTLPYANSVHVAGLTADGARVRLQEALSAVIPSAQVQLSVVPGRRNSVDLVGGVAQPGTYPLTERNLALSSLISVARGVPENLRNPQVQITRGGQVYRRSLRYVLASPAHDPAVQGGDRILVEADPRSFKALGAARNEAVIGFDDDEVSALRALSLMGGMTDTRADPRGILVLRRYRKGAVGGAYGPPADRVVFSFDLTKAGGMFSADEFLLHDGDIVMATQAPATTTARVLALLGSFLGVARAVQAI